jgi:alkanesulfonate monooxygenase SsuD/methylene tetrahydromethanopterin reductase-like flavin-dependent oxidoreductase (luciferase family)
MHFGIFDHVDASGLPQADYFETRLRLVEALDRLGFASYHTAEHHGTELGLASSPSVYLSAVAQRTRRLKFGPLVYLPALYHPMRLAEEICMLDQMSRGRFQIGLGRGAVWLEQKIYDVDPASVPDRYAEALEILFQALSSDTVNFSGRHYSVDSFPMVLKPYQKPRPPIWYGLSSPGSAVWCAANDVNAVSLMAARIARGPFDRYREEWERCGRPPGEIPVLALCRHIVVAETDEAALRIARPAFAKWRKSFSWLWDLKGIPFPFPYPETLDAHMAAGLSIAGSPRTVRDFLAHEVQAAGANGVIGQMVFGSLAYEDALRSLELFAHEVMPALVKEPA